MHPLLYMLLFTAGFSALCTALMHRYALKRLLDIPNERSSHQVPTPRGGGLAILAAFILSLMMLRVYGYVDTHASLSLGLSSILLGVVGFWDDHRSLPASVRLAAHVLGSVGLLYGIGLISEILMGSINLSISSLAWVFGVLMLVWIINLTNFMDGTDGLAASMALFVCAGIATFAMENNDLDIATVAVVLAGASLGFLFWNFPPARIFMGDVGSGSLGILLGGLIWWSAVRHPGMLWCGLILNGAFIADATYTLLYRMSTGQRWMEAHRSHAYQHLAQKHGHFNVLIGFWGFNLFYLTPLAYMAWSAPTRGAALFLAALTPMVILCVNCGAGRKKESA